MTPLVCDSIWRQCCTTGKELKSETQLIARADGRRGRRAWPSHGQSLHSTWTWNEAEILIEHGCFCSSRPRHASSHVHSLGTQTHSSCAGSTTWPLVPGARGLTRQMDASPRSRESPAQRSRAHPHPASHYWPLGQTTVAGPAVKVCSSGRDNINCCRLRAAHERDGARRFQARDWMGGALGSHIGARPNEEAQ